MSYSKAGKKAINEEIISPTTVMKKIRKEELKVEVTEEKRNIKRLYIEAELCLEHVHMLVSIPPKYSVASIMGYLKGKSSLRIFDRHANLKYRYGNRHFWCSVDTVGKNKKAIEEHIKNNYKKI